MFNIQLHLTPRLRMSGAIELVRMDKERMVRRVRG
jgi:hypothetical protein